MMPILVFRFCSIVQILTERQNLSFMQSISSYDIYSTIKLIAALIKRYINLI